MALLPLKQVLRPSLATRRMKSWLEHRIKRTLLQILTLTSPMFAQAADIVVLGEVHDSLEAHKGQAEFLLKTPPTAVVFEMLTPDQAQRANDDRAQIESIWDEGNWPDFSLYAPIFDTIDQAVLVGVAQSRAVIMGVFGDGPILHFGAEAERFGLSATLPEAQQKKREKLQFDAHCAAMPMEMMGGMVDVQRFRDAKLAQAALKALEDFGPPVAVITGNGHARVDWGVPALIHLAAPNISVFSVGFVEIEAQAPYDDVRIVPKVDRGDPCAAFK